MNDINYKSYVQEKDVVITREDWAVPNDPMAFDDIQKFSQCDGMTSVGLHLPGGKEDCADAVRGRKYAWISCVFEPFGKGGVTVKGAIEGWLIDTCTFLRHGKEYDIEVGQFDDYWYPFRKPTRKGEIHNTDAIDGKPLRVRVWDAEEPIITDSKIVLKKVPWIIWFPYFMVRYVQTKIAKRKKAAEPMLAQ